MKNKSFLKPSVPLWYVFVLTIAVMLALSGWLKDQGFDLRVLFAGNCLFFLVTLGAFMLYHRTLRNSNTNFFLRMMYGGLLLKMVVCIVAVLSYVLVVRAAVNKPAIIGCFVFYFIYTFTEVKILTRLIRQQKNA
jgi:hypothetical protein